MSICDILPRSSCEQQRIEVGCGETLERDGCLGACAVEGRAVHVTHGHLAQRTDAEPVDLVVRTEINRSAHTELTQHRNVERGERVQRIASVEPPPADPAAGRGAIPAEVAEVDWSFEGETPLVDALHTRLLCRRLATLAHADVIVRCARGWRSTSRHAGIGSDFPFSSSAPASSTTACGPSCATVSAPSSTSPSAAALSSRAATLTVSPITV